VVADCPRRPDATVEDVAARAVVGRALGLRPRGITNPANVRDERASATAAGRRRSRPAPARHGRPRAAGQQRRRPAWRSRAPILRAPTVEQAAEALQGGRLRACWASTPRPRRRSSTPSDASRTAFVLGSESEGVSPEARAWIHDWVSIPMSAGVESLNVAGAAAVLAFELVRRRPGTAASA
jgi:23S rRNA (guanosine2251-2'-O)-methyltransferase